MSTTRASTRELKVWTAAQRLRMALIAPPTAAVPPSSLGGLDQVRRLAEGLAERGHQVALIGAGLGELAGVGYSVIDTDPTDGQRASAEIVERLHAEQAGKALERLAGADVVSDHTRTGWQPAGGQSRKARTVQTSYRPVIERWEPAPPVGGHAGWVAVSEHQQRNAPDMSWAGVIHPGIPVGKHPLGTSHRGLCVYLGPLLEDHGAGLALEAAHRAGRSIVLAGTQPSPRATAYTEVELRPELASGDELLEAVSPQERWELLASACCLVAPLHPGVAYSLEVVEAMAYGTPVVTMVGTVGAELVSHGVAGLVISDAVLLPGAIGRTERLDPRRVRAHAASRFDLRGMVSAYEWLLTQLAATPGPDGGGAAAATRSDAPARSVPAPTARTG
jgi:Glycosyl transferases group 1